jgi:hypothetical protein
VLSLLLRCQSQLRLPGYVNHWLGVYAADFAVGSVDIELVSHHKRAHYHVVVAVFEANIFAAVIPVIDADGSESIVKSGFGIYIFHDVISLSVIINLADLSARLFFSFLSIAFT